jgi:hypothetical protein
MKFELQTMLEIEPAQLTQDVFETRKMLTIERWLGGEAGIIPDRDYIARDEAGIEGREPINRECTSGEPIGEPKERCHVWNSRLDWWIKAGKYRSCCAAAYAYPSFKAFRVRICSRKKVVRIDCYRRAAGRDPWPRSSANW